MRIRTSMMALCLAACGILPLPAAEVSDFAAMAPPNAFLFLGVGHVSQFVERAKNTPYGKLWNDPDVAKFTQPGRQEFQTKLDSLSAEWKLDFRTLPRLVPGQLAVWVELLDPYKPHEYGIVLVADRAEPEDRYRGFIDAALDKWVPYEKKRDRLSAAGETLYTVRWDSAERMTPEQLQGLGPTGQYTKHSCSYAFPEGRFLMALDGDESIQRLLARATRGGASLAANDGFRPLADSFSPTQFRLFLNAAAIVQYLDQDLLPLLSKTPPVDLAALGLKGLMDLAYRVELADDATRMSGKLRVTPDPVGIAKTLTSFGPLDPSVVRGAPEKPHSLNAFSYDVPAGLRALIAALRQVIPPFNAVWALFAAQVQTTTGLSLEEEIIPAFGSQHLVFTTSTPSDPNTPEPVIVIGLAQADRISRLADSVMAQPGASAWLKKSEFLGAAIYSAAPAPSAGAAQPAAPGDRFHFALTPSCLILCPDGDLTRETIRRLSGKNPGNFLDAGAFRPPQTPANRKLAGFSYQDMGLQSGMLVEWLSLMRNLPGPASAPVGRDLKRIVDLASTPPPETLKRYFGVSETYAYLEADGLSLAASLPNEPVRRD